MGFDRAGSSRSLAGEVPSIVPKTRRKGHLNSMILWDPIRLDNCA
jgi:hypothetical protein